MKFKLLAAAASSIAMATPVLADLVLPWMSYRTGPYAVAGIPLADGYADYLTLLNERDGGIGGVPVRLLECETGYNTEKGVECYESTKAEGSLVYHPLSTGITYQLIPKVTADGIALHSMGYGRTSAANGKIFSNIFNYPANYWTAASAGVNYLLNENSGSLDGKHIALLYHNSAYGKEPIRTLEELSKKHKFELTLIPVDHPGQEQKSQWLQIRRERPDYVIMWGFGVMNQVAIQEAANVRFPMENFIGIWWSGSENDVIPAGDAADGYKALALHAPGMDFPLFDDMKKHVYDKGMAAGAGDQTGTILYNRGMFQAILAAEAVKVAQKMSGKADITAAEMRVGMENLKVDQAMFSNLGLPNFAPNLSVSCNNHGGAGLVAVQQWDAKAKTWSLVSDFKPTDMDVINMLIDEDSSAYAKENNITPKCL